MHCSKKMICLQNSLKNINISVHIIKGLRNFQANTCERFQNTPISYLNVIPKNKIGLRECDKKTKEVKSRIWALPLLGVIEHKTCIAPDEDHQINDALITPHPLLFISHQQPSVSKEQRPSTFVLPSYWGQRSRALCCQESNVFPVDPSIFLSFLVRHDKCSTPSTLMELLFFPATDC